MGDVGGGFGLTPLAGGYSGETFLSDGAGERTVVRVYAGRGARRGPEAPAIDAAVLRLVRGLVPVPDVLEVRRPRTGQRLPGLLVTSFVDGTPLDRLLPTLDRGATGRVGARLGTLLGRLACMPQLERGRFTDGALTVAPWPSGDLPGLVRRLRAGSAIADWPAPAYDGLLAVADRAQDLLDPVHRSCLVHGDLTPRNVLVDPVTLEVTAVVDWELAHAGVPGADLGNLLRFERDPALVAAVLGAYRVAVPDASGSSDQEVLDRARAADLVALVDLAARRGENPVTDRAHTRLEAVAATGDLGAWA